MTGSMKVYSAPQLESLSMRATRDIDVNVGGGVGVHIGVGLGS